MVDYAPYAGVTLIGRESTWGTAVATTKDLGLVQEIQPQDENAEIPVYAIGSRAMQALYAGKFQSHFTIKSHFQHGRLLEHLIGSVAHDATNTPDIKHTFTEANALPSFTFEQSWSGSSNVQHTYSGCITTSGDLDLGLDGVLDISANVVSKGPATSTSADTQVISTLEALPTYAGTVKWGTAGSEATFGNVQSFNVHIENEELRADAIGVRQAKIVFPNKRKYTGRFTIRKTEDSLYQDALGGTSPATSTPTKKSLVIDVSNGTALASGRRELYLNFTNVLMTRVGEPLVFDQFTMEEYAFTALTLNSFYTYDNITSGNWV